MKYTTIKGVLENMENEEPSELPTPRTPPRKSPGNMAQLDQLKAALSPHHRYSLQEAVDLHFMLYLVACALENPKDADAWGVIEELAAQQYADLKA